MTKSTVRTRTARGAARKTAHKDGVRQAWSLPLHRVLSLGVHGDLRLWDVGTGEMIATLSASSPVRFGSIVGKALCCVTEAGQLVSYDLDEGRLLWTTDLPAEVTDAGIQRIHRLGAAHLVLITPQWDDEEELAHVVGPFEGLGGNAAANKVEYGVPLIEHAVVGDAIVIVKRVPTLVEPLNRGRSSPFVVAPEARRKLGKVEGRFVLAGERIITIGADARWSVEATERSDRRLWAWDVGLRSFVGQVEVLNEIEGAGYMFPEEGDLDPPILHGALGFPSGRVLSWGPEHTHLWSAHDLVMHRLLPSAEDAPPEGAFLIGASRLVVWSTRAAAIASWKFARRGRGIREETTAPIQFKPHQRGLTGACHLSGKSLLSWSENDPVLRVWDFATGKYLRGLGE